ncbi:MAG: hypothetical protein MJA29_02990 [Candidatus Omnitrophica bacterium]|nr:hypothetical protein [Candidatus Omnitrophota bacterium]
MKKIGAVFCIGVFVAAALFCLKNLVAGRILLSGIQKASGIELTIGSIDVGLLGTSVSVKDAQVLNPGGFPEAVMMRVPELYVDYDPFSLVSGEIRLEELRVDLEEVVVLTSSLGSVNVDTLRIPLSAGFSSRSKEQAFPRVVIEELDIHVGRVVFKDYTHTPPEIEEFRVDINERMSNVTDLKQLAGVILLKVLSRTDVNRLIEAGKGVF